MSARALVVDILMSLGLLVVTLSLVGALVLRTTFGKLHYVTPVTTVGGPLLCAALVVDTGWGITAGLDILIVGLVAVAGPILSAATARVEAQQLAVLTPESPQ